MCLTVAKVLYQLHVCRQSTITHQITLIRVAVAPAKMLSTNNRVTFYCHLQHHPHCFVGVAFWLMPV